MNSLVICTLEVGIDAEGIMFYVSVIISVIPSVIFISMYNL